MLNVKNIRPCRYRLDNYSNPGTTVRKNEILAAPINTQIGRLQKPIIKLLIELDKNRFQFGTGVIIKKTGLAVTSLHVLMTNTENIVKRIYALVRTNSGDEKEIRFNILRTYPKDDIAILQLSQEHFPYNSMTLDNGKLETGEPTFTLGFTNGDLELTSGRTVLPTSSHKGLASYTRLMSRGDSLTGNQNHFIKDIVGGEIGNKSNVVSTNRINYGCSGGAVLSLDGRLRAIVAGFKDNVLTSKKILEENLRIDESKVGSQIDFLTVSKPTLVFADI